MNILSNRLLLKPIIPIDNPHRGSGDLLGHWSIITQCRITGDAAKMQYSAGTVQTSACWPPAPPSEMRLHRGSPNQSARWSSGAPPSCGVPTTTASNPSVSTNCPRLKILMVRSGLTKKAHAWPVAAMRERKKENRNERNHRTRRNTGHCVQRLVRPHG